MVTRTAGSASGLGKRTRSNPGTAPQADSSVGSDTLATHRPCNFDGAATTHRTPAVVKVLAKPNPIGPAS